MPIRITPRPIPLYAFDGDPDLPGDPFLEPDEAQAEADSLVDALRAGWGEGGEGAFGDPVFEWCPGICAIAIHPLQAVVRVAVGWLREGDREKVVREVLGALEAAEKGLANPELVSSASVLRDFRDYAEKNGSPAVREVLDRLDAALKVVGGGMGGYI